MKRVYRVGLCVVALLIFGAVVASGAQAGELGECYKVARNPVTKRPEGGYIDAACTKKSPKKEGKYEWTPHVKKQDQTFTDTSGPTALVGTSGEVKCKKSKSVGQWASNYTDEEILTFTGCEYKAAKCTTARLNQAREWVEVGTVGDIETFLLDTTLVDPGTPLPVYNNEFPYPGAPEGFVEPSEEPPEIWDLFESSARYPYRGVWAAYICNGDGLIITGGSLGVAGVMTPVDAMEKAFRLTFGVAKGVSDLVSELYAREPAAEYSPIEPPFTGSQEWTPLGYSQEIGTVKIKDTSKVELRECNENPNRASKYPVCGDSVSYEREQLTAGGEGAFHENCKQLFGEIQDLKDEVAEAHNQAEKESYERQLNEAEHEYHKECEEGGGA